MNLEELYNNQVIQHHREPYHKGLDIPYTHFTEAANRSCGDNVTLYLEIDEDRIVKNASYDAEGCIICNSSASILTKHIIGHSIEQILEDITRLETQLEQQEDSEIESVDLKGEESYLALAHVREFPTRKKCVYLSWKSLRSLLKSL